MQGRSLAATLAALITLALPATASAATLTVTNGNDSGAGSLRAAIAAANADAARDQIGFASGVTTVDVASVLTISAPVLLDGGTGVPTLQGAGSTGIVVQDSAGGPTQAESTRIENLSLAGFSDGIEVHADNAQLVDLEVREGSDDGVVIAGDAERGLVLRAVLDGNAGDGLELAGTRATIGGQSLASRDNTIIRNGGAGVRVLTGANGTVSGNRIGETSLGSAGNGSGVVLGSAQVQVFQNAISGNLGDGIVMSACGAVMDNGVAGNGDDGIVVNASSCRVPSFGDGNHVTQNGDDGINVTANDVTIQGNEIGTDAGGPGLGNGGDGIEVTGDSPTIGGGGGFAAQNVIAGSGGDGIRLSGSDNAMVVANLIFANAGHGVSVDGVAGDLATLGVGLGFNQIQENGGDGVTVTGAATARVQDSFTHDNGGLGIDLGDDGVTANDALDADSGPNSLQNFPVLTSIRREFHPPVPGGGPGGPGGSDGEAGFHLRVKGSISVPASGLVQIDLYRSVDCDAGVGEGSSQLGTIELDAAGAGNVTFNETIGADFPAGTDVTATATRGEETSEFSACAQVAEPPTTIVTLRPTSRSVFEGGTAGFTVHRSGDTSGSTDVSWSTHPGSATAPADYAVAGGTVHFAPGEVDKPISVAIAEDADVEPDESFTVTLDDVTNETTTEIEDPTGTVTIRNLDNDLFVVTNGGDDPDAAIDGVCARAGGGCTLRAAIQEANTDADRDAIVVDDAITDIQLGSLTPFPVIDEPLILAGTIASGRVIINGNGVAGLTIDAGAAQQTQVFDVNLVYAPLDVIASDALLQDANVSGATGSGVRFGPGSTGAVGGSPGHGNRIFANGGDGVLLDGSADVNVSHNRIGLDGANALDGIRSSDAQAQVFENTISGNGGAGLRLLACADVVTSNRIGTQADGTGAVPNGAAGVVVAAAGCQVGGSGAGEGNTIAGNTGDGILVEAADAVALGNTIQANGGAGVRSAGAGALLRGNSITANGGLGIDTGAAGDSGDAPQLTAVVRDGGKLHVTGTVSAAAAGQYDIEFSTDAACDPSGSGEGATPIAVKAILAAAAGAAPFDLLLETDLPAGAILSATSTTDGQTSEFAACATVAEPGSTPPPDGGGTPPPGGGTPPPLAAADPQSSISSPRGSVKARKLKRITGTAQDAARVDVAVIRVKGKRCYALTRTGRFKRKTGPTRCSPKKFFKADGTSTWSFELEHRFPPGRYRIYSRATAADGSRETPPDKARARVRR